MAHACAQLFDLSGFAWRHVSRDVNFSLYSHAPRRISNAQAVVPIGRGNHTRSPLRGRERKKFVGCTAQFERSGVLQVFALEQQARVKSRKQIRSVFTRRLAYRGPDLLIRAQNALVQVFES